MDVTAEQVMALEPDGVLLSPGPGDPVFLESVVKVAKALSEQVPMFGICLGHQVIAKAFGAETFKLKFGHRGANHPVRELATGLVHITSQNHGFALGEMPDGISQVFTNLNDRTCEGIRGPGCWSVQFHPEASPGPLDANVLFERVREMVVG